MVTCKIWREREDKLGLLYIFLISFFIIISYVLLNILFNFVTTIVVFSLMLMCNCKLFIAHALHGVIITTRIKALIIYILIMHSFGSCTQRGEKTSNGNITVVGIFSYFKCNILIWSCIAKGKDLLFYYQLDEVTSLTDLEVADVGWKIGFAPWPMGGTFGKKGSFFLLSQSYFFIMCHLHGEFISYFSPN